MWLTKLSLGGNYDVIQYTNYSRLGRVWYLSDIPAGDENIEKLFLRCILTRPIRLGLRSDVRVYWLYSLGICIGFQYPLNRELCFLNTFRASHTRQDLTNEQIATGQSKAIQKNILLNVTCLQNYLKQKEFQILELQRDEDVENLVGAVERVHKI